MRYAGHLLGGQVDCSKTGDETWVHPGLGHAFLNVTRAQPHTHHLLARQRRVPGKEECARLLVEGDEHGPVGGPGLRPTHKADHTLVPQAGFGRTEGPILIHQL